MQGTQVVDQKETTVGFPVLLNSLVEIVPPDSFATVAFGNLLFKLICAVNAKVKTSAGRRKSNFFMNLNLILF
jgi:hypothetical protein